MKYNGKKCKYLKCLLSLLNKCLLSLLMFIKCLLIYLFIGSDNIK